MREAIEKMARKIDLVVDEEKLGKLVRYAEELLRWNKAYNLVGRKIGTEGLIDLCMDAISLLSVRGLLSERTEVLDIGSGAGLPGIPLYIMAGPFPLTMVESQRKKITFLRHVCRTVSLDEARVYPGRLEEMAREEDNICSYDVAMARAVMDPLRLLKLAWPLICEGGRTVLFVGKNDAERLRKAGPSLGERGMKLEVIRSAQRIIGKEHFLVVARKSSA